MQSGGVELIFYILCGLLLIAVIVFTVWERLYGLIVSSLMGLFIAGVFFAIAYVLTGLSGVEMDYKSESRHELRSMSGDNSEVNGNFLRVGELSEGISYLESVGDGEVKLKTVDASKSSIYKHKTVESPILIVREYAGSPWWFAPFDLFANKEYEFRVPAVS